MRSSSEPQPVYPVGLRGHQLGWWQVGFAIGCGVWVLSILPIVLVVLWVLVLMGVVTY